MCTSLARPQLLQSPFTEYLAVWKESKRPWRRAAEVGSGKCVVNGTNVSRCDHGAISRGPRDGVREANNASDPAAFEVVETPGHNYVELDTMSNTGAVCNYEGDLLGREGRPRSAFSYRHTIQPQSHSGNPRAAS
jgi:hypothetical protein